MNVLTTVEIASRLDPEIAVGIPGTLTHNLPGGDLTVGLVRELDSRLAVMPEPEGSSEWAARPDGSRLEIRQYVPASPEATISRSVVLWIHGGGMFLGSARQDDAACQELSENLGVRIASVDYRLAPEHPYPEPLDDCYLALLWLSSRFDRIVVVGGSAGGGLAAGLALLARDRSGPAIAAVQLYYPMLDDRTTDGGHPLANTAVWDARLNHLGWSSYLAGADADAYAAPARADDLSGLPPMYLDTGELDLFHDEDVAFAERVRAAQGSIDLFVEPAAVHAFELIAPDATVSRTAVARRRAWLATALRGRGGAS
ncbi:MAG: alpha/beta hydrolase fold domain-containing protein [Actinomycetota bacterium]